MKTVSRCETQYRSTKVRDVLVGDLIIFYTHTISGTVRSVNDIIYHMCIAIKKEEVVGPYGMKSIRYKLNTLRCHRGNLELTHFYTDQYGMVRVLNAESVLKKERYGEYV